MDCSVWLGIGGAERLVVDGALALKEKGHEVHMYTSHHDPSHCFQETRDGTINVTVYGDWLPRTLFGYCHAVCAYARMFYLALMMVLFVKFDVVICDQVSACIPIFQWFSRAKIIFYCHFPDQLLAQRKSRAKALYRQPIDWLEEKTTGRADTIYVNSKFTRGVFASTFRTISTVPDVLYPSLNFSAFDITPPPCPIDIKKRFVFLSINRFERKKNVLLAIEALAQLRLLLEANNMQKLWAETHLVLAGGYDERVAENVEYFQELKASVAAAGLDDKVSFIRSFSDGDKVALLHKCVCLMYTPANEHFGITPLEAMYLAKPVIAVASGGPLETIVGDGPDQTGFLCPGEARPFANAMLSVVKDPTQAALMGGAGRARVIKYFSFAAFANSLNVGVTRLAPAPAK